MPRVIVLVLCLSALTPASVLRQPAPIDPEPLPRDIKLDPAVALRDLRAAYATESIEQELSVTVTQPGLPARTTDARVRTAPGGEFVLRLGDLTIWTASDELRAIDTRQSNTYLGEPIPAGAERLAAIERLLPPIPIPHLALALSADESLRDLTPYTSAVRWTAAELDAAAKPARVMLTGEGAGCTVTMTFDAERARLRGFVALLRESQTEIRVLATPPNDGASPAAPLAAPLIEGRTRVATIAELVPSKPDHGAATATTDSPRSAN